MRQIKIGLGRIYNASGFTIVGGEQINTNFMFGDFEVLVSVGPNTSHPILAMKFGPPVPKVDTAKKQTTRSKEIDFPGSDIFPADIYCEIVAIKMLEVDNELADSYFKGDAWAKNEIDILANTEKENLLKGLNYIAGFLGFHLNGSLVRKIIVEQSYQYYDTNSSVNIGSSFNVNVIGSFELDINSDWAKDLKHQFYKNLSSEKWGKEAEVLGWVLRAWGAEDIILRFLSLFIPLERVIPGKQIEEQDKWIKNFRSIQCLVKEHAKPEDLHGLTAFLEALKSPQPSLTERFENWASEITLPEWESDVLAFKKFSRMRNDLLHAGNPGVTLQVEVEVGDVRSLESIVMKYVGFGIFGEPKNYI